jgi:pimeloyl-ACP methyl ester carboxylesterase
MPWAKAKLRRDDFAYFDQLYHRWAPGWRGPGRDATLAEAKAAFGDDRVLSAALDYYRALKPGDDEELLRDSPVPGLVVADITDVPLEAYERSAGLLGEGSEAVAFEGAGHWPHREYEAEFHERLLDFLQKRR